MELAVVNKPPAFNLAGNTQTFEIWIAPFFAQAATLNFHLNVAIEIEQTLNSNVFQEVRQFTLYPSAEGRMQFDVASLVECFVSQFIPSPTLKAPTICNSHIIRYRVKASLLDGVSILASIDPSTHYCMLGGLPVEEFYPDKFLTEFIGAQKQFLRYTTAKDPAYLDQVKYISFLATHVGDYTPVLRIKLSDGSLVNSPFTPINVITDYAVVCIPIGFGVLNLQALVPVNLSVVWYEVLVNDSNGLYCEADRFYIDHRPFYEYKDLLYPNSLGGVETIRIRGIIDHEVEVTQSKSEVVQLSKVFGNIVTHQYNNFYASEREVFKGETGYITKEQLIRLRDLLLQTLAYHVDEGRLLAVEVNAKTVKLFSARDSMFTMALEWRYGYDNNYWSNERTLKIGDTCPVLPFAYMYRKSYSQIEVIYKMPAGYNLVEFAFSQAEGSPRYFFTGDGGKVTIARTFPFLDHGNKTAYGRVVCNANSLPRDVGPWLAIPWEDELNKTIITGNDSFDVPYGLTASLTLEGSVLDNDYDEGGAALQVVAVNNVPTTSGGRIWITADGIVTYKPPAAAYVGTDTYQYSVLNGEMVGGQANGTIYLKVGNPEVGNVIFVKLKTSNITTEYNGIFQVTTVKGDVHVYYYTDAAGTIPHPTIAPLDVSVRKRQHGVNQDGEVNDVDTTIVVTAPIIPGIRKLVYSGVLSQQAQGITSTNEFSILTGPGYQPI